MESLITYITKYQKEIGTEFDPQLIIFTLSGCPICKEITTELTLDGYAFEEFDCNQDKYSDIADYLETVLETNSYPFIFITYPEPKVITTLTLDPNKSIYPQITEHL